MRNMTLIIYLCDFKNSEMLKTLCSCKEGDVQISDVIEDSYLLHQYSRTKFCLFFLEPK